MKFETLILLAALGAAGALLLAPKAKAAPALPAGLPGLTGPFFGGSAGSMWSPGMQEFLRPQLPSITGSWF